MISFRLKKVIVGITCIAFMSSNLSFATEVLKDTGQRQTVIERTKQYSGNVDAAQIRLNAERAFQSQIKNGNGGAASLSGMQSKCGSYTNSKCGLACCGKEECDSICTANISLTHGNETCTEPVTTSWCGMSCCGEKDCANVCINYRTLTDIDLNQNKCGGYIKTSTGQDCCGIDDCRNKSCGGQTKTTRIDDGEEVDCCGAQNCSDIRCDYEHSVQDIDGNVVACCGVSNCYSQYCKGQTKVNSKVSDEKNIDCCGPADCHNKECGGYVVTNTPVGQVECCGYEDCHNKECQGRTSAIDKDGNTVECCGIEQCGNISEEKVYEDPAPEACCTTRAAYTHEFVQETSCGKPDVGCTMSQSGPTFPTTGSGPKFKCIETCSKTQICRAGTKIGYQQYAWESPSGWSSSQCPPDAVYKKQECQTVCGGTTGCRTICKNICETIKCSGDAVKKDDSNVCTGTVSCGTSGCHCSNNPNWHP